MNYSDNMAQSRNPLQLSVSSSTETTRYSAFCINPPPKQSKEEESRKNGLQETLEMDCEDLDVQNNGKMEVIPRSLMGGFCLEEGKSNNNVMLWQL